MNKFSYTLFFLIILFQNACFSQEIKGNIYSQENKIEGVSVTVKKGKTIVDFTFTDKEGNFRLYKKHNDEIEIQFSIINYEKKNIRFILKKDTIINLELFKKEIQLEEVVIKKETAISYKKDTITYNTKFFKDGTERVVEDILKKLPGISVNSAGKILYKNKEIESLMIEGDDLFNSQYTIGSKNIDADLVESIEAIDNFNTNKVLHKITDSDKVALNLKLKENKTAINVNATLENDFFSKYNNSSSALILNSKFKAFGTLSINNLGIVNTPNFNFSNTNSGQFNKGRGKELLSQGNFPNFLGDNNSILNNSKYNYNSLVTNLSKKTKSTFNLSYYQDKIFQDFRNETNYKFDTENFNLFSSERQTKRPKTFSFNNTTTYYNEKDLQIETKFLIETNLSSLNNDTNNNNILQNSNLKTESLFIAGKSELTKKISDNSALNSSLFITNNSSLQNFKITPGLSVIDSSFTENTQKSRIESLFIISNIEYYKNWSLLKLKVSNNFEYQNDYLNTNLRDGENEIVNNFSNNLVYKSFINKLVSNFSIKKKKFTFGIVTKLWLSKLYINQEQKDKYAILHNINYKYSLNKKNTISLNFNEDITIPKLNYLFDGNVLNSYKSVINNESNLDYIKNRDANFSYGINDLYNTFYLNFGAGYSFNDKDYYLKNQVTSELTSTSSVLLNLGNENLHFDFSFHKLVPFLKTTVKLNASFMNYKSYNFINDSELRQIKNNGLNIDLVLYTGFKSKINFQEQLTTQSNFFKVNNVNNTLTQIKNEFKIIYKISEKNNFKCQLQTFIPNTLKNNNYNFLNFEFTHKFEKYNLETYLKGQNLLNIKRYEDSFVSDYSTSNFSYNLQDRFVLLGIVYKIF